MGYLTDRKRAVGLGASRTGTQQHWWMTVSSYGLIPLIILFIFIIGPLLGAPHDAVIAKLSQPFPAVVVGLTYVAGLLHFKNGSRMTIEDYTHGYTRQILLVAVAALCYAMMAAGLFALARIAL